MQHQDPFRIASISKQFAAVAVLLLAERGALTLDRTVDRWFSHSPAPWRTMTFRHLLAHTAWIGHWSDVSGFEVFVPILRRTSPQRPTHGGRNRTARRARQRGAAHATMNAVEDALREFLEFAVTGPVRPWPPAGRLEEHPSRPPSTSTATESIQSNARGGYVHQLHSVFHRVNALLVASQCLMALRPSAQRGGDKGRVDAAGCLRTRADARSHRPDHASCRCGP